METMNTNVGQKSRNITSEAMSPRDVVNNPKNRDKCDDLEELEKLVDKSTYIENELRGPTYDEEETVSEIISNEMYSEHESPINCKVVVGTENTYDTDVRKVGSSVKQAKRIILSTSKKQARCEALEPTKTEMLKFAAKKKKRLKIRKRSHLIPE